MSALRPALVLPALLAAALAAAPAPNPPAPPVPATAVAPTPPPDWFEVEVIVFRHTQPGAGASETWPADPGRPAVEAAREPDASGVLAPFMALPQSASRLADPWTKLVKSPRYEPIGYFAWLQPPQERGRASPVRLASPLPPPVPPTPEGASGPAGAAAPATAPTPPFAFADAAAVAIEPPPLPPLRVPLDGTVTVGLQRYLYVALDLVLQPGDLPPLADGTPSPPFRLTETRRMRSKELHYFDHPLFGAIVLITPRPAPPELIDPATGLPKADAAPAEGAR